MSLSIKLFTLAIPEIIDVYTLTRWGGEQLFTHVNSQITLIYEASWIESDKYRH